MAAKTGTYTLIASTTLSSAGGATFSSVPQTYTDLVVVVNVSASQTPVNSGLRFNGDSGTNYSSTRITGDGSSASSSRDSNDDVLRTGVVSTNSVVISHIFDYANTTTYKTVISRGSGASDRVAAFVGMWRNTAAITTVFVTNLNYPIGTTFRLFGIESAK
jgi:hypothetical protein